MDDLLEDQGALPAQLAQTAEERRLLKFEENLTQMIARLAANAQERASARRLASSVTSYPGIIFKNKEIMALALLLRDRFVVAGIDFFSDLEGESANEIAKHMALAAQAIYDPAIELETLLPIITEDEGRIVFSKENAGKLADIVRYLYWLDQQ